MMENDNSLWADSERRRRKKVRLFRRLLKEGLIIFNFDIELLQEQSIKTKIC